MPPFPAPTPSSPAGLWTAAPAEQRALVVVHPGSACGSGDMNAPDTAANRRDGLTLLVYDWPGPIYVVDGDLSDELERARYRDLGDALRTASTGRVDDCASGATFPGKACRWLAKRLDRAIPVTLAGAWYSHDGTGCVEAMARKLREAGYSVRFEPHAILEDSEEILPIPRDVLPPLAAVRPRPR